MKTATAKTVDCFIKKFEAIQENDWCEDELTDAHGRHCALGHCGAKATPDGDINHTPESRALDKLFTTTFGLETGVPSVNDGMCDEFQQPTAKQRILAALRYIKEKTCNTQ